MSNSLRWIVCERSGRWSTALRAAFNQLPDEEVAPQVFEVRGLPELMAEVKVRADWLGLVEVRRDNLAEVLELLSLGDGKQSARMVALLDFPPDDPPVFSSRQFDRQEVIDVLWEAGAA